MQKGLQSNIIYLLSDGIYLDLTWFLIQVCSTASVYQGKAQFSTSLDKNKEYFLLD